MIDHYMLIVIYCSYTYGYVWQSRPLLESFLIKASEKEPNVSAKAAVVMSWLVWVLSPVFFVYCSYMKIRKI